MKLQTLFPAVMLATITALSTTVYADEKATPDSEMKSEKAAPSQATKPHSHVQEKTGVPQNVQPAKPGKKDPAKDRTKHFHPRDK